MFKDYYAILCTPFGASQEEIKQAYRIQSLKWHPDKNPNIDTTKKMQDINEAYLILKDSEARELYDFEYSKFKSFVLKQAVVNQTGSKANGADYVYSNYFFENEILKKWMDNARDQAKEMVKEAIDELKGSSKEAGKSIGNYILWTILPMLFGYLLIRGCHG